MLVSECEYNIVKYYNALFKEITNLVMGKIWLVLKENRIMFKKEKEKTRVWKGAEWRELNKWEGIQRAAVL